MTTFEPSPELVDLGLALGVVTGDPDDPQLDNGFFADPISRLGALLADADQRAAALRLLSRVLDGSPGPPAVGGEQWVPLVTTDGTPRLGLWGVVTDRSGGAVDIALAALVEQQGQVALDLTVRLPLVRLEATGTADFLAGGPEGAISIEAGVHLGSAIQLGDLAIDGVTVALRIPTDGDPPSVEARAQIPPAGEAGDLVLDSATPLGGQLVELLLRFGVAASGDAAGELAHLLDLLGLGSDAAVPPLPVDRLLDDPIGELWDWVRSVATTPAALRAWLGHLGDLVGADPVSGVGPPADPVTACVPVGPVEVCLTLAVDTSAPNPVLVPGVRIAVQAPASFAPGGRATVTATVARVTFGPSPTVELAPELDATVTLGDPSGSARLVDTSIAGIGTVRVRAARAGLAADLAGLRPVLEAIVVDIGADSSFERLDLTDTDALVDVAGAALDSVISEVLDALGAGAVADALLVLAGVRRPSGQTATTWPEEVSLDTLFADPVGAVAGYHRAVLAAGRWPVLGGQLVGLLGSAVPGALPPGSGTPLEPWRLELADGANGTAQLLAWSDVGPDGTRLRLGVDIAPPGLPLGAAVGATPAPTMRLRARAELLSILLTGPGGAAAPVDLVVLGSVGAVVELGDGLQLLSGTLGVQAQRIEAGVVWGRAEGLAPAFAVTDAALVLEGTPFPLPLPRWDGPTRRLVWDGDIPFDLLERLLAAAIEALADATARDTARVLGWQADRLDHLPAVPPQPTAAGAAGAWATPVLRLADLVADPLGAIGRWLASLLAGPQGHEWAEQVLGWVARLAGGAAAGILGAGGAGDPWAAALSPNGRTRLVLAQGLAPAALGASAPAVPLDVADVADGIPAFGAPPALLVTAVTRAAVVSPALRDLLDRGGDPVAALTAWRDRLAGTDGLGTVAGQHDIPGATTVALDGIGLINAADSFVASRDLPGGPPVSGQIFVRTAIGGALDWRDVDPARVVDLTEPGLTAAGFDLTAVSGSGPWFVVLPGRSAVGATSPAAAHAELVARLRRVVDAVRTTRTAGAQLALIAHGPAGHVARAVAADASAGITHLTTSATTHSGPITDWRTGAAAEGLRLVQALRALIPDSIGDLPFVDEALATLGLAADGPPPGPDGTPAGPRLEPADLVPVSALPSLPASVTAVAVAARLDLGHAERALAEVTTAAVRAIVNGIEDAAGAALASRGVAAGWRADPVRPAAGPGIRVRVTVGADLLAVESPRPAGGAGGADTRLSPLSGPRLEAVVRVDRSDGWLLGDAAASVRARSLEVETRVGLDGSNASVLITVNDAAALGVIRPRWVVDLADPARAGELSAEERALLGAVLAGLGPLPASGSLRAAADLLAALGVVTISSAGSVAVDPGALERLLATPAALLTSAGTAGRAAAAAAASALLGGNTIDLGDGFELVVDLTAAPAAITLRTQTSGVALPVGLVLGGSVGAEIGGRVTATLSLSAAGDGPNGRPVLTLEADSDPPGSTSEPVVSAAIDLRRPDGSSARHVALLPAPDGAGLLQLATEIAPASLLRIALAAVRDEVPAAAPLLAALGFGSTTDPIRVPAGLLADPAGWLLDGAALGGLAGTGRPDPARLVALVDAVASLVGGAGATAGALDLPWDLELRVEPSGGGVAARLVWPAPLTAGAVRLDGEVGLALTAAGVLQPTVLVTVDLLDPAGGVTAAVLGGLRLDVTGAEVTASAHVGTTTLPLLPAGPGLGALAGAAALRALPVALDALAAVPAPVGTIIGALGDALGLRVAGTFREDQLTTLAGDPVDELVTRLRANAAAALTALADLARPILPGAGIVSVAGTTLTVQPMPELSVSVDLAPVTATPAGPPRLCVTVVDLTPIPGLAIDATACVAAGPEELRLAHRRCRRRPAARPAPRPCLPHRCGRRRPRRDVELALWSAAPGTAGRRRSVAIADLGTGSLALRCRSDDRSRQPEPDQLHGRAHHRGGAAPGPRPRADRARGPHRARATNRRTGSRSASCSMPELVTRTGAGAGVRYEVATRAFALAETPRASAAHAGQRSRPAGRRPPDTKPRPAHHRHRH